MNLLLFEQSELGQPLARSDRRAKHLLDVLRRKVGDSFDAGIVDSARGKGIILQISDSAITLTFAWGEAPPPLPLITTIVGLPRPQTARDILRDVTTLGVEALHFVLTEKGDPNYLSSSLWTSGEWRRHVLAGAEQAFCTRLPVVTAGSRLVEIIEQLPPAGTRLALDNYESPIALSRLPRIETPVTIALGPERGWAPQDRAVLRSLNFRFVHLGPRVLRTETACVAALTLVQAALGAPEISSLG